jgi:hypothetical protein
VAKPFTYSLFDLFERPECAFPARRWRNPYPATVSGRLRQGTQNGFVESRNNSSQPALRETSKAK